jgi:hypothetical protein
MIIGAEIGLIVFGLIALIRGKMTFTRNRVLEGPLARVLGAVALLPIPVSFVIAFALAALFIAQGKPVDGPDFKWKAIAIEASTVVFFLVLIYAIGLPNAGPPDSKRRKPRKLKKRSIEDEHEDEEEDDEYATPRRQRRRGEEEDEEDEGPRRAGRQVAEENEEELPRRRRAPRDDGDDDPPPRRRPRED